MYNHMLDTFIAAADCGSFTKAAREEASNAGKQQIDLIDGEEFISKLIEYGLGVKERTIYEVDKDFFERV